MVGLVSKPSATMAETSINNSVKSGGVVGLSSILNDKAKATDAGSTLESYVLPSNLRMNAKDHKNLVLSGMEVIKVSKVRYNV